MLRAGRGLHGLLRDFSSDVIVSLAILEDAAYGAPSRITVAKLKELSGVYKFILEAHGVEWLELSPSASKKYITGKGTSEKHVVARELRKLHGLSFSDDKGFDLSDAAALAVWGVTRGAERGTACEVSEVLHKHGPATKTRRR